MSQHRGVKGLAPLPFGRNAGELGSCDGGSVGTSPEGGCGHSYKCVYILAQSGRGLRTFVKQSAHRSSSSGSSCNTDLRNPPQCITDLVSKLQWAKGFSKHCCDIEISKARLIRWLHFSRHQNHWDLLSHWIRFELA